MKRLLVLSGWVIASLVLANMGVNSLYGAVTTRSRSSVPTNWSQVVVPQTNPNPRTQYFP